MSLIQSARMNGHWSVCLSQGRADTPADATGEWRSANCCRISGRLP